MQTDSMTKFEGYLLKEFLSNNFNVTLWRQQFYLTVLFE